MNQIEKPPIFRKFGKLLKYDFLESIYSILLINGILLLLMALLKVLLTSDSVISLILAFAIPLGYVLSLVFLTMTIIRLLYSRIFTPDGYLTFALPVSLDAILISKILVSSIYVILSSFVIAVWALLISEIMNIADIMGLLRETISSEYYAFIIAWILSGVVSIFSMSALVLLILAILHIGAITRFRTLCGIALFMFFMFLESICYGIFLEGVSQDSIKSLQNLAFTGLAFNIFKTAIYYYLARYLIANKLEI